MGKGTEEGMGHGNGGIHGEKDEWDKEKGGDDEMEEKARISGVSIE